MVVEVNVKKVIEIDYLIAELSRELKKNGRNRCIEISNKHAEELLLVCEHVNEKMSKSTRKE